MSTRLQPSPVTPSLNELEPLFEEAARASGASRALKAGYLNAIIARWVQTEDPATLAPALHALLAKEGVQQLVDEQGTPVSAAATQALLAMSYPHPLEVSPEHLEALRRQQEPAAPPAPKGAMLTVLSLATGVQAVCFFLADSVPRLFRGLTVEMLAGEAPLQPPPYRPLWEAILIRLEKDVWWSLRPLVPWGQVALAAGLYYFATALATTAGERKWARRAFLGLGVVGLVLGLLPTDEYKHWGTLAAALGALFAGLMLRVPKPSTPPAA
ncbi:MULTISPECIES: hypothetical protein [unclassified Corallococcus]|uniref:hypothetical protein n=1 Tax=unclassified Corallococcus TaxID=2685029 RepID=UPI001A8E4CE1|nr:MULTISPECIES: hypothetical protein [unclassified Corallococcus]MBN9681832.1 hypothetical protein [Corallococcus sp. NCSPR001]WAS86598.1 hypothetical protein O0N60_06390 [Corallococcus sp. NCRR]